uniref:Uncharacterized protein n=1 Tax=Ditylenchus dipsaci TaxID=166011 RepID=A0A915E045_9BILA
MRSVCGHTLPIRLSVFWAGGRIGEDRLQKKGAAMQKSVVFCGGCPLPVGHSAKVSGRAAAGALLLLLNLINIGSKEAEGGCQPTTSISFSLSRSSCSGVCALCCTTVLFCVCKISLPLSSAKMPLEVSKWEEPCDSQGV